MREDTQRLIEEYKITMFPRKKEFLKAEAYVDDSEQILFIEGANSVIFSLEKKKKESKTGILIITNKRVIYSYLSGFGATKREEFVLSQIESFDANQKKLIGSIEISTAAKRYQFSTPHAVAIQNILDEAIRLIKQPSITVTAQTESSPSLVEQLKGLSELRDSGILTEEEFESKKKQLLDL